MRLRITKKELSSAYGHLIKKSRLDVDFIILTIASAAICSFGFIMNSAAVIIGAMVISPLTYVVVKVGVASFRKDYRMFFRGLRSLFLALFIAFGTAAIVNYISPIKHGSEIIDRLISSPKDYFFVAFFPG